jgi:hypothetical protein
VTQPTIVATLDAPVAAKANLIGVDPAQAAANAPAPSSSGLVTSSPPHSGWSTDPKTAGVIAAVMAEMVEIIETLVTTIWSAGGVVTVQDQLELTTAASLTTVASVAACVSAVVTTIQNMPILIPAYPAPVLDASYYTVPTAQSHQLTPQQVDQVILSIPTADASASRFSDDVKALLRKIKTRS